MKIIKYIRYLIAMTASLSGLAVNASGQTAEDSPLSIDASVMSDTKADFSASSSLKAGNRWSTVISGNVSGNFRSYDRNGDGYMDEPRMFGFSVANRWLYKADGGVQVHFGIKALQGSSQGGQEGYDRRTYRLESTMPWGTDILNRTLDGYLNVRIPLSDDNLQTVSVLADYTLHDMDSWFGSSAYLGKRHSGSLDVMYRYDVSPSHGFAVGLASVYDRLSEDFSREILYPDPTLASVRENGITDFVNAGIYGEYTYRAGEKLTVEAGVKGEWYSRDGFKATPRAELRYSPAEQVTVRLAGGRNLGYSMPLADNIGVMSTGKAFLGRFNDHILEDSWTYGGNIAYSLPFGASENAGISFGYTHTGFDQQTVVDYEHVANAIDFYALDGNRSFEDRFRIDFNVEPVERFAVTASFTYTDAKIELKDRGLVERPMTSRYKGVLNLRYATGLNRWAFDFTASVNGPSRVYNFMEDRTDSEGRLLYRNGYTPVYPMLYAQVTRRFKCVEVYIGGENLTNFRQKDVIIGAVKDRNGVVNPRQASFDASAVWGPLMGVKFYAGVRFTLRKGH